ncbi:hypothetical protein [Comamonas koreensis]|uniref:Uncharacterized protein n=1 Tax=Comamonas koreensis TaxID=160825 RepID=A0AAW4Y0U8_9BURK|nr:hypothetical protein [Comamonas koreensis]MCD2166873.1 hypothetical protein [Comamonas koreensis]
MTHSSEHAELLANYQKLVAEVDKKTALVRVASQKGPQAMRAAMATAEKAERRRDVMASKLAALGVDLSVLSQPGPM